VHDAGALLGGDEVRVDDVVRAALARDRVGKEGLVIEADKVAALHPVDDLRPLVEDLQPCFGKDQEPVAFLHLDVVDVVRDRERNVAGEGPRRGRPGEDRRLGVTLQAKANEDAGVGHVVPVALRKLVARERGGAARAVGSHAKALVNKALLPHLAE